jgi:glycosyltransferase involved in cell wall biosynthesis
VNALRILHVMRAPVGGLFRHVADLAREQAARGHSVGLIADSSTGGERAEAVLRELEGNLALGLSRVPMNRNIGRADWAAIGHVTARAAALSADVIHGHGAKGGAYARLAKTSALRVYTPHGGSLHYSRAHPVGFAYLAAERFLLRRTDVALFESQYARATFEEKVGRPRGVVRVVHNGVRAEEFEPVVKESGTADLLYVGELRALKGVDVLLDALHSLYGRGNPLRLIVVGAGADRHAFEAKTVKLSLGQAVTFAGAMPARQAFARGRLLVVPSRAESLPYIVLEAAAAGLPMIATRVGGIPEIFGDDRALLVPPGDAGALASAIGKAVARPDSASTARLRARVSEKFTVTAMAEGVLAAYGDGLARRNSAN